MRGTWMTAFTLVAACAACGVGQQPDQPPLTRQEASVFALQLHGVVNLVALRYVQPVAPADLVIASLKGLYAAAKVPAPADLSQRVRQASSSELELVRLIATVRLEVGNDDSLREFKAIHACLRAMVESLDPYCALMVDREGEMTRPLTGNFGVGVEVSEGPLDGPVTVKSVMLGGPGQRAGLRPGDQILDLNGKPPRGRFSDPTTWINTTEATLEYLRPGEARPRQGVLKPDDARAETVLGVSRQADNSWNYWIDQEHRIAHIRLANLEQETAVELSKVLMRLKEEQVAGLILDLRWCPGGFLNVALYVADIFMGEYNLAHFMLPLPGNVYAMADPFLGETHCENATVRYRNSQDEYRGRAGFGFTGVPIIVLVNSESSGGAELIAAVLQDNLRARILGQRTRGKGSVQTILNLWANPQLQLSVPVPRTSIKISNGELTRPSGKRLNRLPGSRAQDAWGVQPDPGLEYRVSPALAQQLRTWWQWQDLRPGDSVESLPLDDPDVDPQRQAALAALLQGLR
jgi:carboxyl-terminal processing protease